MKYWFDTEFVERPCTIDLISIGIVSEDGREFYAEVEDFDESKASDWVKQNVLPHLWSRAKDKSNYNAWSRNGGEGGLLAKYEIGPAIRRFVGDDQPEFWGDYADYDWVVFCWLQGTMMDLPKGWPMYCRDIRQLCDSLGNPTLPKQTSTEHNALEDARWTRDAFYFLENYTKG